MSPSARKPLKDKPLSKKQVKRLSYLTEIDEKKIMGASVAKLIKDFPALIDPKFLMYVRVCGQVVKYDETTGKEFPVPFARVHVEDTDCHLIGIYPSGSTWGWFYPIFCHREEIASAVTDACGRFCVWIPRFDIDYILTWRKKWICFPQIFLRPSLKEILEKILYEIPPVKKPPLPFPPWPDPCIIRKYKEAILRKADEMGSLDIEEKLHTLVERATVFRGKADELTGMIDAPAFREEVPPPLTAELVAEITRQIEASGKLKERKSTHNPYVSMERFIGPFHRCIAVFLPAVVPLFDIPDITFKVTQDVNGDGNQETIHSEGLFEVRWDSIPASGIKLYASEIAAAVPECTTPTVSPGKPAILYAGLMPLFNPSDPNKAYFDDSKGYAKRVNRPRSCGLSTCLPQGASAETPFMATLQLYGRNQAAGASFYRILYKFNGSSPVPFVYAWQLYREVSGVLQKKIVSPDSQGWYPIIPPTEDWHPHDLLMNWPTGTSGLYELQLQLGDSSRNPIALPTAIKPINIKVDNTQPFGEYTSLGWRVYDPTNTADWTDVGLICPVIIRPKKAEIQIRVGFRAWADHLRSARLYPYGCGEGDMARTSILETAEHWYKDLSENEKSFDNSSNLAVFTLPSDASPGAYGFELEVVSRAFNPAGSDGFNEDWWYDPVHVWRYYGLPISIVDSK